MWDLPRPGHEPVSLALAGGFLTTAPPGKPHSTVLIEHFLQALLLDITTSTIDGICYYIYYYTMYNIINHRASLVAQWLRICLPMQGTRVRALVWEDPTCRGATKPMCHNYWACASGACARQQERPPQWKTRAPRWRVAPACLNERKPSDRNEDPTQP